METEFSVQKRELPNEKVLSKGNYGHVHKKNKT